MLAYPAIDPVAVSLGPVNSLVRIDLYWRACVRLVVSEATASALFAA